MAQFAPSLAPGILTLLDNYNVENQILWGLSRQRQGIKRLYWALQALKLQIYERRLMGLVDKVLAISRDDLREFRKLVPRACVELVPPGLDLEPLLSIQGSPVADRLVFVGALDWHVNVESCRWMAHEVFPLIRRHRPGASLQLVGRRPVAEVLQLASIDGVEVFADVPSVAPYLAEASAVVVPLPYGSGVQTKVIQSLAAGRAVITTPIGLEGLELRPEEHLLLGDGPQDFALKCLRVLDSEELAGRLGAHGRRAVGELYSKDRLARDLAKICIPR